MKERVESVFVDEFQDTSPLQLAVFVGLSRIAESSVWVGDPKQAIYGFRGTDPDLITYVAQNIRRATGGEDFALDENWRSRPGLVEFFNDAFGPTFAATGLPEKATRIKKVARADLPGQHTPLAVWNIPGGRANAPRFAAIAAGVAEAVADGSNWAVAEGEETRPLAAGDVAVLCRSNDDCLKLANALANVGLKVAIERDGLFGTLEGRLAVAALRWCADGRDTVALAEMAHLLHDGEEQPAWFGASLNEDRIEAISALVPIAADLRVIGDNGVHKTPLEFLDAVLTSGGVCRAVRKWGLVEDRLLNLEELRKLVATYEDERDRSRAPTTVTDLCAWLDDEEAKQPASRAPDAVTVLTYHGSKGLEWPLVVLTDLDDEPKGRAFGAHVTSDIPASEIDWNDPLAKRWLRFWPWPMGGQKDNVVLDASAANSPEGKEAARVELAERSRLLYVGATRARDYLVMALPKSTTGWAWLDELTSDTGVPAFVAPKVGDAEAQVNGKPHAVRVAEPVPIDDTASANMVIAFAGDEVEPRSFPPLALKPSGEGSHDDARIIEEIDLGARLPFAGSPNMNSVGEALHRFLAADDPTWDNGRRCALGEGLDLFAVMLVGRPDPTGPEIVQCRSDGRRGLLPRLLRRLARDHRRRAALKLFAGEKPSRRARRSLPSRPHRRAPSDPYDVATNRTCLFSPRQTWARSRRPAAETPRGNREDDRKRRRTRARWAGCGWPIPSILERGRLLHMISGGGANSSCARIQ